MKGLLDEFFGGGVGIAGSVEFHGEIAAIVGGLRDIEGPLQVDVELFAVIVDFAIFDVGDAVGALEHGLDGAVVEIGIAGEGGVREIGQGAQVRVVHGVDDFDDEKGVLADGIVVLQGDHDVFLGGVVRYFAKAVCGALHVWRGIRRRRYVRTDAWGADFDGYVDPLFCYRDRFLAVGGIGVVEAGSHVGRNIHDVGLRVLQGFAEGVEIG